MQRPRQGEKGQALVMVTFACLAMLGMIGLAVDLGWAHFVKKSAQRAADAGALAAAGEVLDKIGQSASPTCGGELVCQPSTPCPATLPNPPASAVDIACLYAAQNGFQTNGNQGRQHVSVESDVRTIPPTAPGVVTDYWVTVRAGERIPQLFAAVVSAYGAASARATAAVVNSSVPASLVLLNRENDCIPMESTSQLTCGVSLLVSANDNQGHFAVEASGGIYISSQRNGQGGRYAAENTGGGTVSAPFTEIRGSGGYLLSGSSQWVETPTNNSTAIDFLDPMRGKGQPKPPTGLPDRPVIGGGIMGSTDPAEPAVLAPGNYYAAELDRFGQMRATGAPLTFSGNLTFGDGGTGFANYVFFGGVDVKGSSTTLTFHPGMYVMAGVQPKNNGTPNPVFSISSNATLRDLTQGFGRNTDAGEIFIFTDTNYTGQGQSLQIPAHVRPIAHTLEQGTTGFQFGNAVAGSITLHGLNQTAGALPEELKTFAPVVMWQDQANSVLKYTPDGRIDTSCGTDPCPNTALANNLSPELKLQGSPAVHFYGTLYQPRGAWTTIQGGGDYLVPLQIIAGAFKVQGNAALSMAQLPTPIMRRSVALVE